MGKTMAAGLGDCTEALLEEGKTTKDKEAVASDDGQPESDRKEAASAGDEPESKYLPSFNSLASLLQQACIYMQQLGVFFPTFLYPILEEKLPASVSLLQKLRAELLAKDLKAPVAFHQQLLAELFATFVVIYAGCGVITVRGNETNIETNVALVWGAVVVAMVCSVGHVSGAHMNPAVTLGFAVAGRFPWRKVPSYMVVQTAAAAAACLMLRLMFREPGWDWLYAGPVTLPSGSYLQSLMLEFIITSYLMFVTMAVATDYRTVGLQAGLAVGGTIMLNVLLARPVSGASMNPARSMGPMLAGSKHAFRSVHLYLLGPFAGAAFGASAHNLLAAGTKTTEDDDLGKVTIPAN